MKNKTSRTNSMKLKKVIAASLAVFILFAFTGCKTSSGSATTESSKQEDTSTTDSSSSGDLNEKLNDLYQQENQIFADHKDVWDKAFGFMSKNINDDTKNENYADFLANIIESNKDSFSEEEYATLSKDIETIRGIEEEIAKLEKEIAAADPSGSSSSGTDDSTGVFHGFKGKDLDGNDVDESLFAKNKVTVVNFWFSGCKPCVEELAKLNELNDTIKKMGGEVVGINTDTLDDNQDGIKEAKEILKAKGASYKNLTFDSDSTVGKMLASIVEEASDFVQNWMKTDLMEKVNLWMTQLTVGMIQMVREVFNFIIGIIVSIYVLFSKEKFQKQTKKLIYAVFRPGQANMILQIGGKSNEIFGGFIIGKIIDSLIIGVICFIGLSILNMPYTMLVSVIVGVTNVIPFFGPYIGAIPSTILIALEDPMKGVYFLIFILVLQQFDGNILGPKILGNSTGLSAFWVVTSILLGGGLFGFVGMVMGVPTFAVIYFIVDMILDNKLKKKKLPVRSDSYDEWSYVDSSGEYIHSEEIKSKAEEK